MSESYRCPTCESTSVNARNLAVFIDGTSNRPGDESTNVVKLHSLVSGSCVEGPGLEQRACYLKGIGVHDFDNLSLLGRAGTKIYSELEMAFAWSAEENIKKAYEWLMDEYQQGDQIYLFGFSRGAYQVRALAAMIHEVGLVRKEAKEQIEQAYRNYRSIDPSDPEKRKMATEFKKEFGRHGVRIHFIGVWDTVSSLGLIKQDVHITASSSVTNACHFRHALALDERRVKFIPEYFLEMNAHDIKIKRQRRVVSDVKEVWFAGHHSDVGGTSRRHIEDDGYPAHAGNVPLLWMKREAAVNGLVFEPDDFSWDPKDIDLGREEEMGFLWGVFEALPVRHQVAFNGTGEHARSWHLFRPRSVIPRQRIHSSILSSGVYTPRATLRDGVGIPTSVPRITSGEIWEADPLDERTVSRPFTPLRRDPPTALVSLEKVLLLVGSTNGQTQPADRPQLPEEFIGKQSDFDRFALAIIRDAISNSPVSEELVKKARKSLVAILSSPDHSYFPATLDVLQLSTRNDQLRRRFIAHEEVICALVHALERTIRSRNKNIFLLVTDIVCCLIDHGDQRGNIIEQLNAVSNVSKTGRTRLSLILEVKEPSPLTASLKMIASLARYEPIIRRELKPKIIKLAREARGPVGLAAVEALVALNVPFPHDIHISNILRYLGNTLPRLDAEVGSTLPSDVTATLPVVFQLDGSGGLDNEDMVMSKLVRTIESGDARQRTEATLTLLKLCRCSGIRDRCPRNKVLDIFMRQLERKGTSLLAAYALKTGLMLDMWTSDDFDSPRAAELIVAMFNKGWLDDAVGQVEGSEIFRGLMKSDNLRQQVIEKGIVASIIKKFEGGDCHDVRMGLVCLDVLEETESEGQSQVAQKLALYVSKSLGYLQDEKRTTQAKGVKVLSALAQCVVGEKTILPRVVDIVRMLLPLADHSPVPRSQLFGPAAALYDLCRNEALREEIKSSSEFNKFKGSRDDDAIYPRGSQQG